MHHTGGDGAAQLNAEIPVGHAVNGVGAGRGKAQLLGGVKAVQPVGRARQCAAAQGTLGIHTLHGILQTPLVAQQHPRIRHQMMPKADGLRALQVGVAGHNVARALLGLVAQHGDQLGDLPGKLGGGITQVQPDIQRHLIVAAAPGVQPFAGIPHAGGQRLFDKGVDILGGGVNFQRTAVQILQNRLQAFVDIVNILRGDDALLAQHSGMHHTAADVLLDHTGVKPDGRVEVVDPAVHGFGRPTLPKLGHTISS